MTDRSRWFVSTEWLTAHLDDPSVAIVDGSWHLPGLNRHGRTEYESAHIPGAIHFDIDTIADRSNPLPHMLPSPEQFAAEVGALGIDERQRIVVYDTQGLSAVARLWWTFKAMGAKDVVILDGGLPKWIAEKRPVNALPVSRAPRTFKAAFDSRSVVDLHEVGDGLAAGTFQLVDARPRPRFLGEAPEPRSWVKSGRIPGSRSVPSGDIIADGRLKEPADLAAAFAKAGVDLEQPIVTSCGSGVNAAILTLALATLGVEQRALYDGSWTEWGARDDMPVATGPED